MRRLAPIIYFSRGRGQLLLNFEASEKRTAFFFDAVMISKDVENSENALYKIVLLCIIIFPRIKSGHSRTNISKSHFV